MGGAVRLLLLPHRGQALAQLAFIGVALRGGARDPGRRHARWSAGCSRVGTPPVAGLLISRLLDRLREARPSRGARASCARASAHPARARHRAGRVRHARRRRRASDAGTPPPSASSAGPRPRRSGSRCATLIIPPELARAPRRAPAGARRAADAEPPTTERTRSSCCAATAAASRPRRPSRGSRSRGEVLARGLHPRRDRAPAPAGRARGAAARAGGARGGRAGGRDGQRHAAAGGRGARAPHASTTSCATSWPGCAACSTPTPPRSTWPRTSDSCWRPRRRRGRRPDREPVPFGEGFAGRVAVEREPMLVQDPPPAELPYPALALEIDSLIGVPLLAEGEVTGVLVVGAAAPRRLLRRRPDAAAAGRRPGGARDRPRARVRARAQDRRDAPAQPAAGPPAAAARADGGGALPARRRRGRGRRRLVRRDPDPRRRGRPGDGRRGRQGPRRRRRWSAGCAARCAPTRSRATTPARVVEQLNRLLWTEAEESQMATLLYVVVDPAAEHGPLGQRRAPAAAAVSRRPTPQLPRGRQLGAARRAAVPRLRGGRRSRLDPGATVVLYTDGLVERPGEHIDDGLERLAAAVRGRAGDPQRALRPPARDARARAAARRTTWPC